MANKPHLYSQSAHSLPQPIPTRHTSLPILIRSHQSAHSLSPGADFIPLIKSPHGKDDSQQLLMSSSNMSFTGSLLDRKTLWTGMRTSSAIRVHKEKKRCRTILTASVLSISVCALVLIFVLDIFQLSHDAPLFTAGLIGLWPTYGGDAMNQQRPPFTTGSIIHKRSIHNLSRLCSYASPDGLGFTGFITIDNQNVSYFSDASGYITSVHLDTCKLRWREHIGTLLGYDLSIKVATYQTLTLFQDSAGIQGLIFGTPTSRLSTFGSNYPIDAGCYAVALYLNGSLWWKILLGSEADDMYACSTHGFTVDGHYAYGGIAQSARYDLRDDKQFVGRYFMIDVDHHEIVHEWSPFPDTTEDNASERTYAGISMYSFPAIIDDYLIFGTSNLWRTTTNIDKCLSVEGDNIDYNEYLALNESNYMDICGNDKKDNKFYRCLERDLYPSSLVILDKNTFELQNAFVLQGLDVFYNLECKYNASYSINCPSAKDVGFNADLTAIAAYRNDINGKIYVAGSQKSARLHVFNVETGELELSRKYGPQSTNGQFSMAVDEETMIGITSIIGGDADMKHSRYKLANGMIVCATGSIQAFDLRTGNILYQIVNPYGYINDSYCYNDTIWDQYEDATEISDTNCEKGEFVDASQTAKVIIPPTYVISPLESKKRAMFRAPVTIVNDLLIIPSDTGDIWIHDLHDGSFVHHVVCPTTTQDGSQWNRAGIKGGVSVVNDRLVFYCGAYWAPFASGNTLISMKLT